jgi:hypothetical protein
VTQPRIFVAHRISALRLYFPCIGLHLRHRFFLKKNLKKNNKPLSSRPPAWVFVFLVLPDDVLDPYLTRITKTPQFMGSRWRSFSLSNSSSRFRHSPTVAKWLPWHQQAHSIHFTKSTQRISFLVGIGDSGRIIAVVRVKG